MRIDSTSGVPTPAADAVNLRQAHADFLALNQALHANDLSGAQKEFAMLEQDAPAVAQAINSPNGSTGSVASDGLRAIAGALQANDLNAAQTAMTNLQNNLHSPAVYHHHRHHHAPSTGGGATVPTPASVA